MWLDGQSRGFYIFMTENPPVACRNQFTHHKSKRPLGPCAAVSTTLPLFTQTPFMSRWLLSAPSNAETFLTLKANPKQKISVDCSCYSNSFLLPFVMELSSCVDLLKRSRADSSLPRTVQKSAIYFFVSFMEWWSENDTRNVSNTLKEKLNLERVENIWREDWSSFLKRLISLRAYAVRFLSLEQNHRQGRTQFHRLFCQIALVSGDNLPIKLVWWPKESETSIWFAVKIPNTFARSVKLRCELTLVPTASQ